MPTSPGLVVVPAMLLYGALIHWIIIRPGLNKPHLVIVFATMGLSILMQNLALMIFSADLFDVPPIFNPSDVIGPFYLKVELLLGFGVLVVWTADSPVVDQRDLSRQGDPGDGPGRRGRKLMGIPVPQIFLITFAAGSGLVGLSACIMIPFF